MLSLKLNDTFLSQNRTSKCRRRGVLIHRVITEKRIVVFASCRHSLETFSLHLTPVSSPLSCPNKGEKKSNNASFDISINRHLETMFSMYSKHDHHNKKMIFAWSLGHYLDIESNLHRRHEVINSI